MEAREAAHRAELQPQQVAEAGQKAAAAAVGLTAPRGAAVVVAAAAAVAKPLLPRFLSSPTTS